MKIIEGPTLPTPFGGTIKLPDLETPPLTLPKMPDERGRIAIGHSLGEDAAQIVGVIPWAGGVLEDLLEDMHHAEILKTLTPEEYSKFTEYNKSLPSTIAMIRVFCFKEV